MSGKPNILVIDDDPDFQEIAQWMLAQQGYTAVAACNPDQIPLVTRNTKPAVILLDWHLGDVDGTTLIDSLRQQFARAPIVFATAFSSPEVAAAAIKLGAFDFLVKPLDPAKLTVTLAKAIEHHELLDRLHRIESGEGQTEIGFEGLIGISPQMRTVYSIIRNVSPTDVNVLICGESGTGKELVAHAIHARSDRSSGPFVPLNMASIPSELSEATLFGHEKGAFTGADRDRPGAVGEAAGGTLFLDEITEMPLALQGKLLRFLQERTYRPVGGRKDLNADVRILSATNRDPLKAVQEKNLREDLYYRLNVVPILLPPLREREGDIALLAHQFLTRFSQQYGKQFRGIHRDALRILQAYDWPGNVRQLVHAMQQIAVLHDSVEVDSSMLPADILKSSVASHEPLTATLSVSLPPSTVAGPPQTSVNSDRDLFPFVTREDIITMEELERRSISRAIELCGTAVEAATLLGISPATIYRKIKLYGIEAG